MYNNDYQRPSPENEEEEGDNTDSGSYPSVFDLKFSNAKRRLGRRNFNKSTSTLKPVVEKSELSLFSSNSNDNQTHPINHGAGFVKPFSTMSTALQQAQSVEKFPLHNIQYQNREQCKKNFNYDPSIMTPDKPIHLPPNWVSNQKNYPFPVLSSSHDKENQLPDSNRFKEPSVPMKSLFVSNKPFDQVDAPHKFHSALPNVARNGFYSNTVLNNVPHNPANIPQDAGRGESIFKSAPVPVKPLDLSPSEKAESNANLSADSSCFETAVMSTSKLHDSPLDLSNHSISQTIGNHSSTLVELPQCLDMMNIQHQQEPPVPKPANIPLQHQAQAVTPVKPISKSQSNNESTPVFKRPLSVSSYKQPSVNTQDSQKSTLEKAKSNFYPQAPNVRKPQAETSKDLISIGNKQYKVLGPLGKGGSSSVYFVQETEGSDLKPLLALKVVDLSTIADTSTAEGYLKEVNYLEKLQGCPCVIKMYAYEYDTQTKHLYVVMEKGDSDLSKYLRNINKTTTTYNDNIMLRIIQHWYEMLIAVKAIHAEGIIHSDLKPANFLFVGGVLKIIDFGIASSLQGDQTSVYKDTASGTLNYMSPETVQDISRVSYKSDVWSLGCILYNMIYGKTPYSHIPGQLAKMRVIADVKAEIEFKSHGNNKKRVPPVLLDSMRLCLQKNTKDRPTVDKLLDIVQSWYEIGLYVQLPPSELTKPT